MRQSVWVLLLSDPVEQLFNDGGSLEIGALLQKGMCSHLLPTSAHSGYGLFAVRVLYTLSQRPTKPTYTSNIWLLCAGRLRWSLRHLCVSKTERERERVWLKIPNSDRRDLIAGSLTFFPACL